MLRKIEYLIPAALEAIDGEFKSNTIPSGYQGAISGFGASLLQMGLLPTLAVYEDKDSDADIDRQKLLKALKAIVKHKDSLFLHKNMLRNDHSLLDDVLQQGFPKEEFKEYLIKASIAFKLAIRTYKLSKS